MTIPYFFISNYRQGDQEIILDQENSRHVIQVLRMKPGEAVRLTDGKGHLLQGTIAGDDKKRCLVAIGEETRLPAPGRDIAIGISLLKNSSRFEWFLEKATEIGVARIFPLVCERTERQRFREERMKTILVSALLQSQQVWLPELGELRNYSEAVLSLSGDKKMIAHCMDAEKVSICSDLAGQGSSSLILIGPEGDFTDAEIKVALQHNFIPVSLGNTRLRSETAGVVAAALLAFS